MTSEAHFRVVMGWLNDLSRLYGAALQAVELEQRMVAIGAMLADNFQDDRAFGRDSLDHVAQLCPRYFPSYGEAYQALASWWRENRPRPDTGRAIEGPPRSPFRPTEERPSEEQIARNRALVREVTAALEAHMERAREAQMPAPNLAKPGHLSDGQLLATYEKLAAEGNRAAMTRLEMLRKKLHDRG